MRVRRVAAAAAAAVLMAAKAAAAGGGGGRSSLFDRLSANAAAESEGARTRRLLATGTAAEPKKAATKKAETQLPSIPGRREAEEAAAGDSGGALRCTCDWCAWEYDYG